MIIIRVNGYRKQKHVLSWGEVILIIIALLIATCAWMWIAWKVSSHILRPILFFVVLVAIFYCDNSGIRLNITKKLPKSFPFYNSITQRRDLGDRLTQYLKTGTYLCLLISCCVPYVGFVFTGITILLPVLAIIRYIRHSDIIRFASNAKNYPSPTVTAVLTPALLFSMRDIFNHEYNNLLWILIAVISLAFIIPFLIFTKEYLRKFSVLFGYIFCVILFVFGSLCSINRSYDLSQPEEYSVKIVDKHFDSGRSQTLYVTVTPWKNQQKNIDIEVDKENYSAAKKGEFATIIQHKGLLKMSWYYLKIPVNDSE